MTPAQKAKRTLAVNKAMMHRIETVERPGKRNLQEIINHLLCRHRGCEAGLVRLWFNPGETGTKLKHEARKGTLVGFKDGFFLRVKPDGYKTAGVWHPVFWRLKK